MIECEVGDLPEVNTDGKCERDGEMMVSALD